jgi:hypothetical protein
MASQGASIEKLINNCFNWYFFIILEAVLSALSRVLREDWRKSLDLTTNIIYTFFCFSTYTHFHSVIVQYKIGSLCMDVIEYELKRYEQMKQDLDKRKNAESGAKDMNKSQDNLDGTIMNVEKPKEVSLLSFCLWITNDNKKSNYRWNRREGEFQN